MGRYFDDYYNSFINWEKFDTTLYTEMNQNTYLYNKIHEYDVLTSKNINTGFNDFQLSIKYKTIEIKKNYAKVFLSYDLNYHYKTTKNVLSRLSNVPYTFELIKKNNSWKIISIQTNFEDYDYFKDEVKKQGIVASSGNIDNYKEKIDRVFNKLVDESKLINIKNNLSNVRIVQDSGSLRSISKGYSYTNGLEYAKRFAVSPQSKRLFYTAPGDNDCTNFVSQCVWAGYGGYIKNDDKKNKQNIKNKVRMVPGTWYGGTGGGSSSWESVNSFWAYTTKNKTHGPNGKGFNNNALCTKLSNIGLGDVIQSRNGGKKNVYKHSMYVTLIKDRQTYVSQHKDRYNRPLTDVILKNGGTKKCYLRRIQFSKATFSK
ncbi:amidase domain-containing protein [Anaerostipes sp.]|uniref:amidase domain-containing protein n=1 Tax=Anaerostipes sp. TaxID=1872530 RepID=UPI0025C3AC96|nr:amidase domain-containing protein [Anaerostipes sp.]MBS7008042.1 amidase domain-containing protein [Anaerostipes sp.]